MGIFDTAQGVFNQGMAAADRGVAVAKEAVSGVAVEQRPFVKNFVRLCADAYAQGWHEANGGNLSYLMSADEVTACRPFFYTTPGAWNALSIPAVDMAGSFLLVTVSGGHFRNVAADLAANVGIVEIDGDGISYRVVWGMKNDGNPTSELALHLQCLSCARAAGKTTQVVYHAHPAHVMALTATLPVDGRGLTRALWQMMAEAIIAFPGGVEELDWMAPGTPELAMACAEALCRTDAAVAVNHGVFCAAPTLDGAFGLMHTLDKAAEVRLLATAASAGAAPVNAISDEGLRAIAERYNLKVNEGYLAD